MDKRIFLLALLISSIAAATVSLHNLQAFFNNTYDANQDGYATIQ